MKVGGQCITRDGVAHDQTSQDEVCSQNYSFLNLDLHQIKDILLVYPLCLIHLAVQDLIA